MRWGKVIIPLVFVLQTILVFSAPSNISAQDGLHLNIYGPGQKKMDILLVAPGSPGDSELEMPEKVGMLKDTIQENLSYLFFLKAVQEDQLLGEKQIEGARSEDIDFKRLRMSNLELLITMNWNFEQPDSGQVELRAFEVYTKKLLVGRGYIINNGAQVIEAANRFCSDLMKELTGNSGFFNSRLAFSKKTGDSEKEIYVSTPRGRDIKKISDSEGVCLSPAWSWSGERLAYTHIGSKGHELKLWDQETGQIQDILLSGKSVISPAFTPEGDLVVSADPEGNPDIYFVDEDKTLGEALVKYWGIDISPGFDKKNENMVFVSSRLGNPHIFLLDLETGDVSRISTKGKYNTDPDIAPNGRYVAFARRTKQGHRIVVKDMQNGKTTRITSGPGNDESPTWGPDGYFLLFSSNRSGEYKLYLTTRFGDGPKMIDTGAGSATAPDWSNIIK